MGMPRERFKPDGCTVRAFLPPKRRRRRRRSPTPAGTISGRRRRRSPTPAGTIPGRRRRRRRRSPARLVDVGGGAAIGRRRRRSPARAVDVGSGASIGGRRRRRPPARTIAVRRSSAVWGRRRRPPAPGVGLRHAERQGRVRGVGERTAQNGPQGQTGNGADAHMSSHGRPPCLDPQ